MESPSSSSNESLKDNFSKTKIASLNLGKREHSSSPCSTYQCNTTPKLISSNVASINKSLILDETSSMPIHLPLAKTGDRSIEHTSRNHSTISEPLMYMPIQIQSYRFNVFVDTGASISCITLEMRDERKTQTCQKNRLLRQTREIRFKKRTKNLRNEIPN